MKRQSVVLLAAAVASAMSGLAPSLVTGGPAKARATHVVLVSIDGLAASYFDDPRADVPTLRLLAKKGVRARGMITSFPSVTWPSHCSLITGTVPGTHGVIGNAVWNREKQKLVTYIGDPELTKDQAVHVPTLYDVAKRHGLTTAAVNWPCCTGAKSLDWTIPDSGTAELHARYTTPGLVADAAAGGIDISKLGKWGYNKNTASARDELYTAVVCHLLTKHKTNLSLLHLITPDAVEHAEGPHTPEAYKAVADSDRLVKQIWDTVQKQAFADRTVLFIVSDHGFAPVKKYIHPTVVLKQLGFVKTDEGKNVTGRRVWCVSQGGSCFVYVLDQAHKQELLAAVKKAFAAVEGVQSILAPDQFHQLGLPDPRKSAEVGDLVLTTGPGYSFKDNLLAEQVIAGSGNYKGTHGHPPDQPFMHATFIAVGAGIRSGMELKTMRNIDVAPTIARLTGLPLPDAEGRVLEEILSAK